MLALMTANMRFQGFLYAYVLNHVLFWLDKLHFYTVVSMFYNDSFNPFFPAGNLLTILGLQDIVL